jgi:hypothetical protein
MTRQEQKRTRTIFDLADKIKCFLFAVSLDFVDCC